MKSFPDSFEELSMTSALGNGAILPEPGRSPSKALLELVLIKS